LGRRRGDRLKVHLSELRFIFEETLGANPPIAVLVALPLDLLYYAQCLEDICDVVEAPCLFTFIYKFYFRSLKMICEQVAHLFGGALEGLLAAVG